jgi:hypothetical protein
MKGKIILIVLGVVLAVGCWLAHYTRSAVAADANATSDNAALLREITALRADITLLRADIGTLRAELARGADQPAKTGPDIVFTSVPKAGGGADTRGDIAGRVQGVDKPETYRIVLYTHTDIWYVQPLIVEPFTAIDGKGNWENWTHLGTSYAALLVRPTFKPKAQIVELPDVGGDVVAVIQAPASK